MERDVRPAPKTPLNGQFYVQRLAAVRHFRGLPEPALQAIVGAGRFEHLAGGEAAFNEGDPSAGMYVLLSGRIHIGRLGRRGQLHILSVVDPVIMFNEVAALDGGPNPTQAIAVEPSLVWHVDHEAFQGLLHRFPEVGLGLLPVLAARNRSLMEQHEDVSCRSVLARTAKLLLDLSDYGAMPIDRRQYPVGDMAARVCTVREPLSRALRSLRESELISCTSERIIVQRPDEVARQACLEPGQQAEPATA